MDRSHEAAAHHGGDPTDCQPLTAVVADHRGVVGVDQVPPKGQEVAGPRAVGGTPDVGVAVGEQASGDVGLPGLLTATTWGARAWSKSASASFYDPTPPRLRLRMLRVVGCGAGCLGQGDGRLRVQGVESRVGGAAEGTHERAHSIMEVGTAP